MSIIIKIKNKTKKYYNKKTKKYKKNKKKQKQKGNGIQKKIKQKSEKLSSNVKYSAPSAVIKQQQMHTLRQPKLIDISDDELYNEIVENCRDLNECLTLGIYGEYVKKYFNNFNDLRMINENNIVNIGSGDNSIIVKLPFKKKGLISYVIIKYPNNTSDPMGMDIHPDNLFYEYYVGKYFINNYNTIFPCFLETYNCYTGNIGDVNIYSYFKNKKNNMNNSWSLFNLSLFNWFRFQPNPDESSGTHFYDLEPFDVTNEQNIWSNACRFSRTISITIQYFNNSNTMTELLPALSNDEIICCLYQVYFPLSLLGTNYTHYDLHSSNVLRYSLDSYIKIHYHNNDENEIIFYTNSIFKIIDYGRNYFNNDITNSSNEIRKVCLEPICNDTLEINKDILCGDNHGFSSIKGSIKGKTYNFISPNKHNVSHDLRFVNEIKKYKPEIFGSNLINAEIIFRQDRGTPEVLQNTFTLENRVISNIFDMKNALDLYLINNPPLIQQQPSIPELHVYSDGRNYTYDKHSI
jgi:hypothetical protein